jgi:hypothetical protein
MIVNNKEEILAAVSALECKKIYDERDRGYNKALRHVCEKLRTLLVEVPEFDYEQILDLVAETAHRHEYADPDSGNYQFSALGFAKDFYKAVVIKQKGQQ